MYKIIIMMSIMLVGLTHLTSQSEAWWWSDCQWASL